MTIELVNPSLPTHSISKLDKSRIVHALGKCCVYHRPNAKPKGVPWVVLEMVAPDRYRYGPASASRDKAVDVVNAHGNAQDENSWTSDV